MVDCYSNMSVLVSRWKYRVESEGCRRLIRINMRDCREVQGVSKCVHGISATMHRFSTLSEAILRSTPSQLFPFFECSLHTVALRTKFQNSSSLKPFQFPISSNAFLATRH